MAENTEYLALWGGRFTSGPSPELARLSKPTRAPSAAQAC